MPEQRTIHDIQSGPDRFKFDLRKIYDPYPFQRNFHESPAPYGFLGGAAGPGKTAAGLMEQFHAVNAFNLEDGPKVHTLSLRRTFPNLAKTVITRFRELFPKELYLKYNETKSEVTWLNHSTTLFGSMQYEYNAFDYQGQWLQIYYDELCEFTFKQWMATSAWNRCPVSSHVRKYGSGNPIGIGAVWCEDVFVKGIPCMEMDASQKRAYSPKDYPYFEATYLDNPIYANDQLFLKNLESYPEAMRDALKFAKWGAAGGYFRGAWDEAVNMFPRGTLKIEPWWKQWISGNWGYAHPASYYKHVMDDQGILYTYDELFEREKEPEELARILCEWALEDGKMPQFQSFAHSFDAAATKKTATMGENSNSVNNRMLPILRKNGIPAPHESTRDKLGRDTLMRERMRQRVRLGEDAEGHLLEVPAWQISDLCRQLKRIIPIMKSDEDEPEKMEATTDGTDSPLQGAGYGLYAIFGRPREKPRDVQLAEVLQSIAKPEPDLEATARAMAGRRFDEKWGKTHQPVRRNLRWSRPR